MRKGQTDAVARAVRRLVEEPGLWLNDVPSLQFEGLNGVPHGFVHPAQYELAMTLLPGDTPPPAAELAKLLGMSNPSLAPTDYPELREIVDTQWAARHVEAQVHFTIKIESSKGIAQTELSVSDALWGPILVERL